MSEPCKECGAAPVVMYGPDIRFPHGSSGWRTQMWRAQGSGDCMHSTFTRFTRDEAMEAWNHAMAGEQTGNKE